MSCDLRQRPLLTVLHLDGKETINSLLVAAVRYKTVSSWDGSCMELLRNSKHRVFDRGWAIVILLSQPQERLYSLLKSCQPGSIGAAAVRYRNGPR